ncbi:MAG TPA: adenylate/guanylate cyclase domain-containing protein [Kofleriaceae bacterium]
MSIAPLSRFRRKPSPEDVTLFEEAERLLLIRRWTIVAPVLMVAAFVSEAAAYVSPEFPKSPFLSGAIIAFFGALWMWARRGPSRTGAALIWVFAGWASAAWIGTACVESGRFHSLHVLGIATIVSLTPAALSFTLRESLMSVGGSVLVWVAVCLAWKVEPAGLELAGLSTSLMYLTFISGATVLALTWGRQLRLREFVARRQIEEMHRFAVEEVLLRHLPPAYVNDVLAGTRALDAPPERRVVTVIFADIVSFTPLSDSLAPEVLGETMARFYDVTSTIAFEYGATIDKFIGDAVMAILGAPAMMDEHEQVRRAVELATAWHARVSKEIPGDRPLSLRIGIHQSVVAVGTFGGRRRTDYTVLGIGVNLAARLEQACPPGCILVSQTVWQQLDTAPVAEARDLQLKGIPGTVRAYAITPTATPVN